MPASPRLARATRRICRSTLWKSGLGMVSALACACFARNAGAQINYYWDGNGATTGAGTNTQVTGTWGTSPFWSTDATGASATSATGPGSGDIAVFTAFDNVAANNPTGGYTVTLGSAQSVLGVIIGPTTYNATYANNDGTLTLAGTGAPGLSIGANGVTLNGSSGDPTFAASLGTLTLTADQTWTINNAHVIATAAAVAGNATAGNVRLFTLGNVGSFTNTFSGVISDGTGGGSLALTLNNTASTSTTGFSGGTWSVTGVSNTFTGATTIVRGNLQVASIANLGTASSLGAPTTAAAGTISMGSTTLAGSLTYNGGGVMTTNRVINLAGTTGGASIYNNSSNAANTLTFTSALSNNVAGAKTFTLRGSNVGQNSFGAAIGDSTAGGALTLSKQDAGTWVLGGVNTYTGGTTIAGGTLSVGAGSSLGANAAGNNVTISGGNLLLSAATNFGASQTITVNSGGIGVGYTPASLPAITDNTGTTGGIYGINYTGTGGVTSETSGSLYNGNWFLGSFTGGTYTGTSLGAGNAIAGTTSGATGGYRLGGGGGTLTFQNAGVLTGNNDLLVGNNASGGTLVLPGGNTFTGKTTVQNGILNVTSFNSVTGGAASSSLGAPTTVANGTIALGSGSNAVGLAYSGAGETTDRVLNFSGTTGAVNLTNSGTGNIVFTAAPTFTGVGAKTITFGTAADTFGGTLGPITDTTSGIVTVVKNGTNASTWFLNGTCTNSGNTTINAGVLSEGNVPANTYINLAGTGSAAQAVFQSQGTLARTLSTTAGAANLNWSTFSGFAAFGGKLTMTFNAGAQLTWGANGFLGAGAAPMVLGSTTSNNQVELTNGVNLNTTDAFNRVIFVQKGAGGDSALLSGIITNGTGTGAASGITKQGSGTLILSNANTFSGAVLVSGGSLVAGGNSANAAAGAFGTGLGPSSGNNTTVSSTVTLGDGSTGAGGNPAVLIGGAFTLGRTITATDSGTNNVYSIGGTTDNTATFSGAISIATGITAANNNSFAVTQVATTGSNALTISGGISGGASATTKTVTFNNVGAVNVTTTGVSDGPGGGKLALTKINTGTLTLATTNTYTGGTTLSAGTLLVNGSTAGGSALTVTGGTLGGGGMIGGATTLNGGSITGGTAGTVGILTMTSAATTLTMASTSSYLVDIGTGATSDRLSLTGAFLSNGATVVVNSGTLDGTSTYTIATYASDTGSTFQLTNAPGYQLFDNGTMLQLIPMTPVPEPSTWAVIVAFAGLGAVIRARRRK